MKRKNLLFLFILFPLLFSGCWDYTEYEEMAQVIGMGVDYNKNYNKISVTIQYASTEEGKNETAPNATNKGLVHSATDKTFFHALNKLQQVINHKIFFGYTKVIVIGEDAAKYVIGDLIEYLDRTPSLRSNTYVVISSSSAEEILSTVDLSHTSSSSDEIYNLLNLASFTGGVSPTTLMDFTRMLAVGGIEATAPRVIGLSDSTKHSSSAIRKEDNIRYDESHCGDLRLAGVAAFKGDKFLGWLNEKESLGFELISGKKVLTFKTSEASEDCNTKDLFYYRLNKSKSKITPKFDNGKLVIDLEVKVTAELRKYYSNQKSNFLFPEQIKIMEEKLSESINSDIQAALKRGQQELKTDIFGFGFAFFRKYITLWQEEYGEKWADIFPNIPINVNVTAKITNTGTNNKSLFIK
jgi:spore germination protein KC